MDDFIWCNLLYVAERTDIVHPDRPYYFTPNYGFASPLPGLYEALLELYPGVKKMGYLVEDEAGARIVGELSQNIARAHVGVARSTKEDENSLD